MIPEEVEKAYDNMKPVKAVGEDGLTSELLGQMAATAGKQWFWQWFADKYTQRLRDEDGDHEEEGWADITAQLIPKHRAAEKACINSMIRDPAVLDEAVPLRDRGQIGGV